MGLLATFRLRMLSRRAFFFEGFSMGDFVLSLGDDLGGGDLIGADFTGFDFTKRGLLGAGFLAGLAGVRAFALTTRAADFLADLGSFLAMGGLGERRKHQRDNASRQRGQSSP